MSIADRSKLSALSNASRRRARLAAIATAVGLVAAGWLGFEAARDMARIDGARAIAGTASALSAIEREGALLAQLLATPGSEPAEIAARAGRLEARIETALESVALSGAERAALTRIATSLAAENDVASTAASLRRREIELHARALADLAETARNRETATQVALASGLEASTLRGGALLLLAAATGGVALWVQAARLRAEAAAEEAEARRMADANAAREARSRFAAMMSHELRTPMNGLLGLLGLIRQREHGPETRALLDRAERAGAQMTAMLGDMLEVETAETPPRRRSARFHLGGLAQSLRDLLAPAAEANGVAFEVCCDPAAPQVLSGDGRTLQRALNTLCGQVLEDAGTRDVSLRLGHAADEVRAELTFVHEGGVEAGLRLVRTDGGGAQDTLGALLAAGLLERVGGRLEVSVAQSGRIAVLAAAPAPASTAPGGRPRVRVLARTQSLDAIGVAVAGAAGVEVLADRDAPAPDVALIEAGGAGEAETLAEARRRWPHASLIALGAPEEAGRFDGVIAPPFDVDRVALMIDEAWRATSRRCREQGERPSSERLI